MIYLGTAEAFEKPTQALRKTALVMAEASKHMELGEYNFNFMDGYIPRDSDIEYDSDCLENLIEWKHSGRFGRLDPCGEKAPWENEYRLRMSVYSSLSQSLISGVEICWNHSEKSHVWL